VKYANVNHYEPNRPDLKNVGQRIKHAREALGLSQEKFGELVGKSQRTISDIERGEVRLFLDDLYRFANILEKPVVHFLEDDINEDDLNVILIREIHQLPTVEAKQTLLKMIQAFTAFFTTKS